MRVAGGGRLKLGRKTEDFKATEVPADAAVPILRAYLKKWAWEVGAFFDGVGPESSDAELLAIAPDHPVFKLGSMPRVRLLAALGPWAALLGISPRPPRRRPPRPPKRRSAVGRRRGPRGRAPRRA